MTIEIKRIKEWWAAKDLVSLPGMAQTERGVHFVLSKRKKINSRNPSGKSIEYNLFDLPRETQGFILKTNVVKK